MWQGRKIFGAIETKLDNHTKHKAQADPLMTFMCLIPTCNVLRDKICGRENREKKIYAASQRSHQRQ